MQTAPGAPQVSDRACAIDALAVLTVAAAICVASHRPVVMTMLVPTVLMARFLAWRRLPAASRRLSLRSEVAFFALCTLLGGANDWNTVVRHHVYDYTVPNLAAGAISIPFWMLLYWGMILRFVATLCRWERLAPPASPSDAVHVPGRTVSAAWLKIGGEIGLTVATRQTIYVYYLDPLLSWLPFAAALAIYALVFRLTMHERRLVVLAAIGGPLIEILFIQVGGLHRYHLGWFGGVPLWIILWWILAVLIWNDLTARLLSPTPHEVPPDPIRGTDAAGGAQHGGASFYAVPAPGRKPL